MAGLLEQELRKWLSQVMLDIFLVRWDNVDQRVYPSLDYKHLCFACMLDKNTQSSPVFLIPNVSCLAGIFIPSVLYPVKSINVLAKTILPKGAMFIFGMAGKISFLLYQEAACFMSCHE